MRCVGLRCPLLGLLLLLACLGVACATDQGATSEKKPRQRLAKEERSRKEWDERVLQNTWYAGSEYSRQQDDSGGIDVGEWLRTRKELKAKQEETEKRLAQLEEQVQEQHAAGTEEQDAGTQSTVAEPASVPRRPQQPDSQQGYRFKVALIFLPVAYGSAPDMKTKLIEAAGSLFAGHPWFILVEPEEAEEILAQQGLVVSEKNVPTIAKALSAYPAARLVLFVDKLALERKSNILEGHLGYTVVDGFSGRTVTRGEEIASIESNTSGKEELLRQLLARTVLDLEKRSTKYAWSSRVAMVEGKSIYLSAGEASGLKLGDIFAVYGPGKEIIHPMAKVSMGFQHGPYKGAIKVLNLFGRDAAEATVFAGPGKIEVNDLVVLPEKRK